MKDLCRRFRQVVIALIIACGAPVHAQSSADLPPSPAYGVAQRICNEAYAASDYAQRLAAAGKTADADAQKNVAGIRARQAIEKYNEVVQSHTYGHTGIAAESQLAQGRLYRKILHDDTQAAQAYKKLHDSFESINFPDKAVAESEYYTLRQAVDLHNRTTPPYSYGYRIMDFLVALTGRTSQSYWIAIIMISVLVKLAMWGVSNKQYQSIKETQKLQPLVKEIQAKYKNDREAQGRKMMELYSEHGVNPMAGCAPMLLQLPVWWALWNMINAYQFQFQNGHFLWIGSPLAKMYPDVFARDLSQPDIPILIVYALSMYVSMKMTTPPADPQQAEQQRMMSVMMPFMSAYFFLQYHWPSAFLLYYLVFNILGIIQQQWYMKKGGGPFGSGTAGDGDVKAIEMPKNGAASSNGAAVGGSSNVGATRFAGSGVKSSSKGTTTPKVHPKKKRR